MPAKENDFLAILRGLVEHQVNFIVVGGIAAVLQGAPIATFDLDVVHSRAPTNIRNLLDALDQLNASYRAAGRQHLRPDVSHLQSSGHQLLMTRFGPLDLLGSIGKGDDYGTLLKECLPIEIAPGLKVTVLSLSAVIRTKEETAHEKDMATLAILRRTLEEKERP
jgi:hypothetical protein